MQIKLLTCLILFGSAHVCHSVIFVLGVAHLAIDLTYLGIYVYDLINNQKEGADDAKIKMHALSRAMEEYRRSPLPQLQKLHNTMVLQHFETHVEMPADNLIMWSEEYFKKPSNYSEQTLLNECKKSRPLNALNAMKTKNFFKELTTGNHQFPHIESVLTRIVTAINKLTFMHYTCLRIEGQPRNISSPYDIISHIINATQRHLDEIEKSLLNYAVTNTIDYTKKVHLYGDLAQRNLQLANATAFMLAENYGYGTSSRLENHLLPNGVYAVRVSQKPVPIEFLPQNAMQINQKINGQIYHIFAYRSNVSIMLIDPLHDAFVRNLMSSLTCDSKFDYDSITDAMCTEHELCLMFPYDKNAAVIAQNNVEQSIVDICGDKMVVLTGLPVNMPRMNSVSKDILPNFMKLMVAEQMKVSNIQLTADDHQTLTILNDNANKVKKHSGFSQLIFSDQRLNVVIIAAAVIVLIITAVFLVVLCLYLFGCFLLSRLSEASKDEKVRHVPRKVST